MAELKWKAKPDGHDYPAALDFLTLVLGPEDAKRKVRALKRAPMSVRKAKDIIRASGLPVLPVTDAHVAKALAEVKAGEELSPILLVRSPGWGVLLIADGYHRSCASYHIEDDTPIPCKLV